MTSTGFNPKSKSVSGRLFYFGDFVFDSDGRFLSQNGSAIKLTSKSFELLQLLLENHGEIVSREEILRKVWEDEFVEDSNVNVQIAILRKILGTGNDFIQTISKRGYCFTAKVVENNKDAPEESALQSAPQSDEITSLAVLPLTNLDGNEELDYFADGLTESLINLMSKMSELKVMAYRTVARFKGQDFDVAEIGRTLNVESILTGRVRQFRDEVTISAELIRVADDSQIWGTSYQRSSSEIFQIQKEITQTIAEKLFPKLNSTEKNLLLSTQQTQDADAYDAYLKGCHFLSTHTKEGLEKSLEYFNKAIGIDQNYALSYVGIANAYFLLNGYSFAPVNDILSETKKAIESAFAIAPDLAEVHATLGTIKYVYEWNWQEAESEFLQAIKFNPNYTFARYWYVVFLMLSGRFTEAREQLNHLAKIDPLSLSLNKTSASLLYYQRRYEESIQQAEKTLELYPDCIPVYPAMAISFAKLGEHKKAVALMEKGYKSAPSLSRLAVLGYLSALAGNKQKAKDILRRINTESSAPVVENFYIHIKLGEIEEGFEHLENTLVQKDLEHVALIVEPRADKVRSDPRFIEILSKIH